MPIHFLKIRDAVLTEGAMKIVVAKKRELEGENGHCPMNRGIVVNILLKEYAEILEKHPELKPQNTHPTHADAI